MNLKLGAHGRLEKIFSRFSIHIGFVALLLSVIVRDEYLVAPDVLHCGREYGYGMTAAVCQGALNSMNLEGGDFEHIYAQPGPGERVPPAYNVDGPRLFLPQTYRKALSNRIR